MKWHSEITFSVFNDAWHTWNTHFRKEIDSKIREKQFMNLVSEGIFITMKINDFKTGDIENVNSNRLKAKTASQAYPPNDRPRGAKDISSIKWLQTTNDSISPVVILQMKRRKILLDGVHRLVASALLGNKTIPILLITI